LARCFALGTRASSGWTNRPTQEYLLRRLVSCRRCGRAECVSNNGHYAYYRCLSRARDRTDEHQACCQEQSVPTGALAAVVWADLCQVLSDPAVLAEAVRRAQAGWRNDDARTARQQDLRQRCATLERPRQRRIDAYAAETVTLEELQTRVRALDGRLTDLVHEEEQLATSVEQKAQVAVLATQVGAFRATIAHGLDQAPFARRRELAELLIDRVLVAPPEVEIRYTIRFGGAAHRKLALQPGHPGATYRPAAGGGAARWRTAARTCGTTGAPSRR
jgi:site-specific DNA recombinase